MVASPTYLYGLAAAVYVTTCLVVAVVLLLLAAVVLAVWPGTQIGGTRLAEYILHILGMLITAVCNENTDTSDDDKLSFYVVSGDNNALYTGTQILSGSKLGNGRFLSAPEVSVSQPKLNGYGLMSEVW